jgi:hypothetical protein
MKVTGSLDHMTVRSQLLPVRDISTRGSQRLSSIGYRVWPRLPAQYKQVVVFFYRIKITIYYERTRYIILLI